MFAVNRAELLLGYAKELKLTLESDTADRLLAYMDCVLAENEVQNLTAITDEGEFIVSHIIDSLSLVKYIPENASVLDVGTGAGFPGMVIKIVRSDVRLSLLDSLQKRLSFIERTANAMDIPVEEFIHARAEDGARNPNHRERYDFVCARAVASLPVLLEYCAGFVRVGGRFVAMKGRDIDSELIAAAGASGMLGLKLKKTDCFALPASQAERALLIYEKKAPTNPIYPRLPKKIREKPLR